MARTSDTEPLSDLMLDEFGRVHERLNKRDKHFDNYDRRFDGIDEELRVIRTELKSIRDDRDRP
jgi:hypothetical protein